MVTDSVRAAIRRLPGASFERIDTVPPGAKGAFRLRYSL